MMSNLVKILTENSSELKILVDCIRCALVFFCSLLFSLILTTYLFQMYVQPNLNHNSVWLADLTQTALNFSDKLCETDVEAENRIAFIDASGDGCLSSEKLCSLESAAISNPSMEIYVYLHSATSSQKKNQTQICPSLNKLKKRYGNIIVISENLHKFLKGTHLEKLSENGTLQQSKYPIKHLGDVARAAILYKYGGISLEWDVIVLRSLICLRNLAGQQVPNENSVIQSNIMVFDRGHKLLNTYMKMIHYMYDPNKEQSTGSYVLTDAAQVFCDLPDLVDINGEAFICKKNFTFTVTHFNAFKQASLVEKEIVSAGDFALTIATNLRWSYVVHSLQRNHSVFASNLYKFLTTRLCPTTYTTTA